ncbi:MAG: electron transfer flavoprotein subunit beta/FixA family protein [Deltaproteobacteria bacterium]|nr:electron transfer flavoprotein subunit beta/FixA family protein [Deltaproteobacteria bacterium]
MNIVALVKQVPDTEAQIRVKPDGSGIDDSGIKWVMNPYDEFGVEEALKLKEKAGGDVTIVSVGPARCVEAIRTALAMGADKGIHIDDPTLNNADAYTTANALAAAIKGIPYDVIFCGQRAIDDDSGQVGSILAELLDLPQLTIITKLDIEGTTAKAVKPIEGAQLLIESSLPCVITAQKGLNEPRYASLPGVMKAKKKPLEVKDAAALGITADAKAQVAKTTAPPSRPPGKIIDGADAAEKAAQVAKLLREEAKVI